MFDKDLLNKQNYLTIILISFPVFYIIGSFFLNISIMIISIYCLINYSKVNIQKKLIYIFSFLFFIFIINSILSIDKSYSLYKSIAYLRYFFFTIGIILIFSMINENSLKLVSKIFIFITIFLVVDILFEHFTGKDFFGNYDGASYNRLSGPFGDEWIVGFFLLYFGFLSFGLFIKHHKVNKLFYFIFIITICYSIYLTGERNAFFSSLIFIFLMIILDKKNRKIFSLSFLVIVILFTLSNKYNIVGNKYSLGAINQINTENELQSNEVEKPNLIDKISKISLNNHWVQHYLSAFEIFKQNKFLGSGFKSFRIECLLNSKSKKYLCSSHPHNIYFELLSDTGLFGFIIFLLIIIYPGLKYFSNKDNLGIHSKIFFALFITYVFPLKPHGSLFTTSYASMLWFLYSLNLYYIINNEKKYQ